MKTLRIELNDFAMLAALFMAVAAVFISAEVCALRAKQHSIANRKEAK